MPAARHLLSLVIALTSAAPSIVAAQNPAAPWSWSRLEEQARQSAPSALPGIAYLESQLAPADASFLFSELAALPDPSAVLALPELTAFEPAGEARFWKARFEAGFAGFHPDTGLAGLVDAAATLVRIRLADRWGAPQFSGATYAPAPSRGKPPQSVTVSFDYTGAERLLDYLERDSVGPADREAIAALPAWQAMLEHRGAREITPAQLLVYLDHAHRRDPLHLLYKWVNPTGFWNLAGVSLHVADFRRVLRTVHENEPGMQNLVRGRVAAFLPGRARVHATVMFLFSRFADGWAAGPSLGIDLEHFGDDYEHLLRVITHEVAHQAQNTLGLPLPDLAETAEDQQLVAAMRGVYREGMASYVAPARVEGRTPGALADDFSSFGALFRALFQRGDISAADSIRASGLEGAGAFYSMGAFMAATIDTVLGRNTLTATLRTGPIDFFARYVEAYQAPHTRVADAYRFPPKVEERLLAVERRYPVQVLRDVARATSVPEVAQPAALAHLERRYAGGPSGILFDILASELLIRAGDYHGASTRLARGLAFAPNREEIASAMGYRFMRANARGEALTMFNLFITYAPESAAAYASRCNFYFNIDEIALAWGDCRQALRLDPGMLSVRALLGEIERRLGG